MWDKRILLLGLLLTLATTGLYFRVSHHPFLNLDDNQYVTANPHVQDGLSWDTVRWAFTTYHSFNWHPLTWLSHSLDVELFGLDSKKPHLENLALHVLNVLLLFWVLVRATDYIGRSAMVAALFALHPINVESVAWIAERKNLLSMLCFLLALGTYRWYVSRPSAGRYCLLAWWFAMGLLAKPQIITLPFVLLLWDYWPLQRMTTKHDPASPEKKTFLELVKEKTPLFALCVLSAVLTIQAQKAGGALATFTKYSLSVRLENALVAYLRYLQKAFWPSGLALMYPHPGARLPAWEIWLALTVLLSVTGFTIRFRRRRYLLVGWLWFLGTMVPMIGIVQVGHQAMADRYAYLPFVGLFIMICWGVAELVRGRESTDSLAQGRTASSGLLSGASVLVLLVLVWVAHRQLAYWSDNLVLWSHANEIIGTNSISENRIADELLRRGEPEAAMEHFERAAAIKPSDFESNFAIAVYRQRGGDLAEAIRRYQAVVDSAAPPDMKHRALTYMSYAYRDLGDTQRERECRQTAEKLRR